jgi:hypothetical protein
LDKRQTIPAYAFLFFSLLAAAGRPGGAALGADDRDLSHPTGPAGALRIETGFPSGSGVVEEIDQQRRQIRLSPTPHENRGWVCWWFVKITGITPGETITVDVGDAPWATPDRGAFSLDGSRWRQTEPGRRNGKRIVYQQKIDSPLAWFAWGPPFTPQDAAKLVEETAGRHPFAHALELCRTRAGRPVPALQFSQPGVADANRYGIWIQARQHAWESGSSWVCRGLVEWLASADPRAESLRMKSLVTVVPVMDIDNVAIGAGGKNQAPHDHNRDWSEAPHWPSVASAIERIKRQDALRRFDLFIDLHNPGADSKDPYYYVPPRNLLSERGRRNLDHFLDASRLEITGALAFRGRKLESGPGYDKRWQYISKNWVTSRLHDHVVAATLETPWNTPHSTTDGYLAVGRELGRAIERYFRSNPRRAAQEPAEQE